MSAWIKEKKPCLFTVKETPSHSVGVRELMPSKMPEQQNAYETLS